MSEIAFIIGSARSGTTILGDILNCHHHVIQWYEPYYLWRRYFLCKENEIWRPEEYDEKTKRAIQKEHHIFLKKSKKKLIVEKMPSHAFNISYIHQIFPAAKWIHIIRDGRDVVLSMKKEWDKRKRIIVGAHFPDSFKTALRVIKRPPFLRYKLMLLFYELTSNVSLQPSKYLNKAKWQGEVGWGPRFEGWKEVLQTHPPLAFNAFQWVKTVEAVHSNWPILLAKNKIELKYEDLLKNPDQILGNLLDFLKLDSGLNVFNAVPNLKTTNFNKWKKELTTDEIELIKPILGPCLKKLGYLN